MKKHLNKTLKTLVCKAISPMGGGGLAEICVLKDMLVIKTFSP